MTEDKFEEFLKKAAQEYNAPPARAPRDEMWAAIQAKRAAGPRVVYGGGTSAAPHRHFGSRVWWSAAAAGLVLVAAGVGIGRWSASGTNASTKAPVPQTAGMPAPSEAIPQSSGAQPRVAQTEADRGTESAIASHPIPSVTERSGKSVERAGSATRRPAATIRVASACAVIRGCAPVVSTSLPETADSRSAASSAYQLTTIRHLSDAEALLTSFRTRTSADRQMDAQLAKWARDLLTNTRLLLDSPVANDPQRRPLLEDLELVLVQIVQLSPGSTPQDHELIEKTLQQEHVLTRLRTAIPAGSQRGS
ncbi:MAG TPA: hypothetical protein VGD02_11080 [Gemmatimonadaceae bacterium]